MALSPLPPGTVARQPVSSLGKRLLGFGIAAPVLGLLSLAFVGVTGTLILAVVAVVLVTMIAKDSLVASLRWNRPTLQISSAPYALGSAPVLVYRRKPKRVMDISSCTVSCHLVCEERATYTQGTDTTTDTRRVYERQSSGAGEGTAEGLVAEIELHISAQQGAPSLKLPHNEVVWFAEISISGQRLPRDSHRFIIDVAPVLDPSYRVGVQDT